jgi:putative restriction endonuclease
MFELDSESIVYFVQMTPSIGKPWSRSELLILLNLYEKIPFGKFDQGNPVLADLASCMERTPGSVAMKLSNLASLDARLQARGIKGLSGASALDRAVWNEFHAEQDTLVPESEALLAQLLTGDPERLIEVLPETIYASQAPKGTTESTASVKVRRGQQFFRQAVLNAYGGRCAVTGNAVRDLLIASHIVPWNAMEEHRLDPQNGIALNALHDKAFDKGLITFDSELRLVCAPFIRDHFTTDAIAKNFKVYQGLQLVIPAEASGPKAEYLDWHRNQIFQHR